MTGLYYLQKWRLLGKTGNMDNEDWCKVKDASWSTLVSQSLLCLHICVMTTLWKNHAKHNTKKEYSGWNKTKIRKKSPGSTYIIPEEDIVHPVGEGFLLHGHTLLLQLFDMIFFIFSSHGHLESQKLQWGVQCWRDVSGQLQNPILRPVYVGNPASTSTRFSTTSSIITFACTSQFQFHSTLFLTYLTSAF